MQFSLSFSGLSPNSIVFDAGSVFGDYESQPHSTTCVMSFGRLAYPPDSLFLQMAWLLLVSWSISKLFVLYFVCVCLSHINKIQQTSFQIDMKFTPEWSDF